MADIKPFACIRPSKERAAQVAALPYDVYNSEEARQIVQANPYSFLAIDRAETSFPQDVDIYADCVYERAHDLLEQWIADGIFEEDTQEAYYLYEQTMNGRVQTGIVACASIDDYENNIIKKHENTRADKERDRIRHVDACNAQTGPIFLAYRANAVIQEIVAAVKTQEALYDFVSEDGVRQRVFRISDGKQITAIQNAFAQEDSIYIADGHHRAASAVRVGQARRQQHPDYDGTEEFNRFLSVLFPSDELAIMDYNRVIKDFNGLTEEAFLEQMKVLFDLEQVDQAIHPSHKGEFMMYLGGDWYRCQMHREDIPDDPVGGLDVSVLQEHLLAPVLGIADPKTDSRIDFVGGIRGLSELERRCHTDCVAAVAMYPTSIEELFAVADAGLLMPPKSTWFEPKLRSGLFIHRI